MIFVCVCVCNSRARVVVVWFGIYANLIYILKTLLDVRAQIWSNQSKFYIRKGTYKPKGKTSILFAYFAKLKSSTESERKFNWEFRQKCTVIQMKLILTFLPFYDRWARLISSFFGAQTSRLEFIFDEAWWYFLLGFTSVKEINWV